MRTRTPPLQTRLSEADEAELRQEAERRGMSLAALIRLLVRRGLREARVGRDRDE